MTEEQVMLSEMPTKLAALSGLTTPEDLETVDRTKGWRCLAEAGLLSLPVRDGAGGPGASGVEVMLVAEALGGALAPGIPRPVSVRGRALHRGPPRWS